MQEQCCFCSRALNYLQEIIKHYDNLHKINVENSPTLESYVDVISREPSQFFMEQCQYCNGSPFTDPKVKARHYLARHLKLVSTSQDNFLIRRIGNRFIEFSIDFNRFIENVSRKTPDAVGEFRLTCCIVNQSATEIEGRLIYTNSCFTTAVTEGTKNEKVKEFLYLGTKKRILINGKNSSNVYFYHFDFMKIHFLTSNLENYIDILS